ncbi:MAG: hypothetical protein HN759_12525 [Akkermansiaceae bacterium]|jgi:hypothetical protein|nr:hypothetical protein [Akkermansiaceae bacterium]
MFNWFGKFLCLVTVIAVTDAHLVFTQGWAWSTMLQDRAPERGMVEAIESTFNGAEPCPMCCAVQQERQEEQEEAPVPESNPTTKWIPIADSGSVFLWPPAMTYCRRASEFDWCLVSGEHSLVLPPPQNVG